MSSPTNQPPPSGNTAAFIAAVGGVIAALIAAGTAIYLAHNKSGSASSDAQPSSPPSKPAATSPRPGRDQGTSVAGVAALAGTATFTFDALGGGSNVIRVFPGVGANDQSEDGTYYSGDRIAAECKTTGRTVVSDPRVGERTASSDVWIKLATSAPRYASLTYGHVSPSLSSLRSCP